MNIKNLIIIAVIAIVAFGGTYWYRGRVNSDIEETDTLSVKKESKVGEKTLMLLAKVNSLKLDNSIFKDQAFKNLQEYKKEIPDEPAGRINPFAPTRRGSVIAPVATSSIRR